MPWKQTTLAQFLKGATILAAQISAYLNKKMSAILILKSIIQMFLSGVIDQINAIQSLIAALMAQGFYVIILSASKGNWNTRLRFAPNAPPEDTTAFCTTGVCVIATAPSFDASIQAFMSALNALKAGIPKPDFSKSVIKQKSIHVKATVPKKGIELDVWKTYTIGDLFEGLAATADGVAEGLVGFIADLQHTVEQIAAFASSALALANTTTGFIDELNNAGAFAIFLKPQAMGFVDRLVSEDYAPPQDVTLYSVGFCACFYAVNFDICNEKYQNLCEVFDADIEYRDEEHPGYAETYTPEGPAITPRNKQLKIKSWATPGSGYFKNEVYVTLNSNVPYANIYYTVNGADPRTTANRLLFNPDEPIRITQNNSVIKHYAQYGSIIERITRIEQYKIVMSVDPAIPYSPTLGILAGVGVIPGTTIADPTISPNILWGKYEIPPEGEPDLDARQTVTITPYLGDPGNLIKNSVDTVIGISDEYTPPANVSVIYPDDPDEVVTQNIVVDLSPGTRVISETGLKDVTNGTTVTNLILDAGLSSKFVPASFVAYYGSAPWGSISNFPDTTANWIWNMGLPKSGSFAANLTVIFDAFWENTELVDVNIEVYYMANNSAMFYVNELLTDTDTGWYAQPDGRFLSSYQIPNGYRKCNLVVPAGNTVQLRWSATNWGGSAGLIFTVLKANTSEVLLNSASASNVSASHPDWFLTNVIQKSEYAVPFAQVSFSVTIDVYYNIYTRVDLFTLTDSQIASFASSETGGLLISEDKNALEGLIDFPGTLEIPLKLVNGMTVKLRLVVHGVAPSSTLTEYSPIAQDLRYKCNYLTPIKIKLSARNTQLPLSDPALNFLILGITKYGKLLGSGTDFTYTPNPQKLEDGLTDNPNAAKPGSTETLTYLARNMRANSAIATITIDLI